jgi:hypothetical protein
VIWRQLFSSFLLNCYRGSLEQPVMVRILYRDEEQVVRLTQLCHTARINGKGEICIESQEMGPKIPFN